MNMMWFRREQRLKKHRVGKLKTQKKTLKQLKNKFICSGVGLIVIMSDFFSILVFLISNFHSTFKQNTTLYRLHHSLRVVSSLLFVCHHFPFLFILLFSLVMFYKLHFNWLEINCYSFIHFSHFLSFIAVIVVVLLAVLVLSSYIRRLIEFNRH